MLLAGCGQGTGTKSNTISISADAATKEAPLDPILDAKELACFERLGPPGAADWRGNYPEDMIRRERHTHEEHAFKTAGTGIVLFPTGDLSREQQVLLEGWRCFVEACFQRPTRIAKGLPLPASKGPNPLSRALSTGLRDGTRATQWEARRLTQGILASHYQPGDLLVVGVINEDLWVGDLHYVFGFGNRDARAAVVGLPRLFPDFWGESTGVDTQIRALRRGCKLLAHEIGHVLGLGHCQEYYCVLNGVATLRELDRTPLHFCPRCIRGIQKCLGIKPSARYLALAEFQDYFGLEPEARLSHRLRDIWASRGGESENQMSSSH